MIKPFTNSGIFMLAPAFLIASDFVVTKFSQSGTKKIVSQGNNFTFLNQNVFAHNIRSSWIQNQENENN